MEDHDVPCSIKYLYGDVCEFTWWTDKDVDMDRVLAQNGVRIAEQCGEPGVICLNDIPEGNMCYEESVI
jgi:hypothetical protein